MSPSQPEAAQCAGRTNLPEPTCIREERQLIDPRPAPLRCRCPTAGSDRPQLLTGPETSVPATTFATALTSGPNAMSAGCTRRKLLAAPSEGVLQGTLTPPALRFAKKTRFARIAEGPIRGPVATTSYSPLLALPATLEMQGSVPITATYTLTNAMRSYLVWSVLQDLAALGDDPGFSSGRNLGAVEVASRLNVHTVEVTCGAGAAPSASGPRRSLRRERRERPSRSPHRTRPARQHVPTGGEHEPHTERRTPSVHTRAGIVTHTSRRWSWRCLAVVSANATHALYTVHWGSSLRLDTRETRSSL